MEFFLSLKDGWLRVVYRRRYLIALLVTLFVVTYKIIYHVPNSGFTFHRQKTLVSFEYKDILLTPTVEQGLDLFLLILVSSSPHTVEHMNKRNAIRQTWGDCPKLHTLYHESRSLSKSITCKLVFYLARSDRDDDIAAEAAAHKDILMIDYKDSYMAITRKVITTFRWADKLKPKFILKADDDVFIHTPKLIGGLLADVSPEDFYGGIILDGNKVVRTPGHRHFVSRAQYKDDYYPPYCKGAMYVFSGDVLPRFLRAADYVPYMHVDDAYVGTVMYYIGIETVPLQYFIHFKSPFQPFRYTLSDCLVNRAVALSDSFSAEMIRSIHERIQLTDNTVLSRYLCYTDNRAAVILCCLLVLIMVTIYNVLRKHRVIGFHYKQ